MPPEIRSSQVAEHDVLDDVEVDRHVFAETLAHRLDPAMGVLGIIFAAVVLAQSLLDVTEGVGTVLSVIGWVLWTVFVAEFILRMIIAPSTAQFLKRNWWQALFLLLPFLRFFRVLRAVRLARAGRVVSSSVRATRGAGSILSGRLAWLSAVTVIVVLGASQLLVELGSYRSYADALYEAALNAVTGQPLRNRDAVARVLSLTLGVYSVVVFASLAGMLGAYFLGQKEGTHWSGPGSRQKS